MTKLFGWDAETWDRALEWAGVRDISSADMANESKRARFIEVRKKWLKQGGPMTGPITQFA